MDQYPGFVGRLDCDKCSDAFKIRHNCVKTPHKDPVAMEQRIQRGLGTDSWGKRCPRLDFERNNPQLDRYLGEWARYEEGWFPVAPIHVLEDQPAKWLSAMKWIAQVRARFKKTP